MDIDEDDDFYAPEEPDFPATEAAAPPVPEATEEPKADGQNDELEEGEEEDEGGEMEEDDDDSDVDIIVERKDGSQPAPPSQSKYSEIRNIPQRSTGNDEAVKAAPVRDDRRTVGSGELPAVSASKVDVNAIPIHKGTGKPITQVNIDEDLKENDKPWRQPGTDLSDYFNYGFDEFTWALYADKQERLRGEYSQDAIAQGQKKMMEDMMMMIGGGGGGMMPGMPGATGGAGGGQMPPMDGMPPEMQAMVQQMMMGGGMDGQMDPSTMAAMFAGMQNGGGVGANGGQGGQGQNFQGGFAGNQGQGYGFDPQMAGGNVGGGNRGNFGGRGRGGRRNW